MFEAFKQAGEFVAKKHTPLAELIPTNAVYLALAITATAGTTTTVDYYPDEGKIWFINRVRIVTSANTKAVQKVRCKETEALNQVYQQQDVAVDSDALTPPKYYWKDDMGCPVRTPQIEFVFNNAGAADEDQTVEIFGIEAEKVYGSPPLLEWQPEGKDPAYFRVPCIQVTAPFSPMLGMAETVSFMTGKYATQYPCLVICNPDYTEAVLKTDDLTGIETMRADAECTEITEQDADALVESWYLGYAFDPEHFVLRKVPNVFGVNVRSLKDQITMELISYDSLPHLVKLDGFRFIIKITTG